MGLKPEDEIFKFLFWGLAINLKNMKPRTKVLSQLGFSLLALLMPLVVFAQSVQSGLQASGLQSLFGTGGLNSSQSLQDLIVNIIRLLLMFAGAIAVVFVIIGGYQYLTSGGNEEQAEKGKKTLINAIIGIVVIVMSYVVINVIVNMVSSNSGYGF